MPGIGSLGDCKPIAYRLRLEGGMIDHIQKFFSRLSLLIKDEESGMKKMRIKLVDEKMQDDYRLES